MLASRSKPRPAKRRRSTPDPALCNHSNSRYKIDHLPPPAQTLVFRGFARGDTYAAIRAALAQLGFALSKDAIARYRRRAWPLERNRLKRVRATVDVLKEGFLLDPSSTTAQIAEELLYTEVCNKMLDSEENAKQDVFPWLREAREQKKLNPRKQLALADSPQLSDEEIDRRIREIYGLPPEPDNGKKG